MRVAGVAKPEGAHFTCGVYASSGTVGGLVEFLLDTGSPSSVLALIDFKKLGGDLDDLRPTTLKLTHLKGHQIPCRLFEAPILEFGTDGQASVYLKQLVVPEEGMSFSASRTRFSRFRPHRRNCVAGRRAFAMGSTS